VNTVSVIARAVVLLAVIAVPSVFHTMGLVSEGLAAVFLFWGLSAYSLLNLSFE
jgi:hypothetical protein